MIYLDDFIRIIIACFLGGLIGYQRQKKGMSMGLRTHIVVCVSAALVQIISIDYNLLNEANVDAMRLGAQVISGIGFLGMASIIKDGRTVVGLTTAASIWFIACVGLAAGSGLYIQATMATLVIYFILKDIFNLDKRIKKNRDNDNVYELEVILNSVVGDRDKINVILNTIIQKGFEISDIRTNAEDKNNVLIIMAISLPPNKLPNDIFAELLQYEYVKKVAIV
ncbi:MgtC/SapB family protein [Clostridium sp. DJ247]|nr:MgtC/SapB family protein [Clostridium sp. DJ247]